jgi:hypothetical protein
MDLPFGGLLLGVEAVRLVPANGDLGVPSSVQGPLVQVGRTQDDVLVIN